MLRATKTVRRKIYFHAFFLLCLLSLGGSNPAFIMQISNIVLSRMLFRKTDNLQIKLWAKSTAYEKKRRRKNKTKVHALMFINKINRRAAAIKNARL